MMKRKLKDDFNNEIVKVLMTNDIIVDIQTADDKALITAADEVTSKICQKLCSNNCIIAFANIKLAKLKLINQVVELD